MPQGTKISDDLENDFMISHYHNGYAILRLERKKDYTLRFLYKGQEAKASLSGSLEPGWLVADLITYYIGYIVDAITGDWNSFDEPLKVRFPADTTQPGRPAVPIVELNESASAPLVGIVVSVKGGLAFPIADGLGFSYGFGLGYEAFPRLTFLLAYDGGTGIDILSRYSNYYTSSSYSQFNLEGRFKQGNFYITGGGGWSNITSDSLTIDRSSFNVQTGTLFDNPLRTAPVNKSIPTLFVGIGITGSMTFFEIRHTFGLSNIPLSNGEIGKFETTTLTFGLNFHF
jgi:hypothetical protein